MLTSMRIYDHALEGDNFVRFFPEGAAPAGEMEFLDVEGLGPVKHDIRYSDHAAVNGGVYHSSIGSVRNVVITAAYNPDHSSDMTAQDLRRHIYRVAMPGRRVRLRFYNNGSYESRIDGYVEDILPDIFEKEPTVKISIICVNPWLVDPSEQTYSDNPSTFAFDYGGEIEWGLYIDVRIHASITWIRVEDVLPEVGNRPDVWVRYPMSAGQRLRIVTNPGAKEASLRRDSDGVFLQRLIGRMRPGEHGWPMLRPGANRVRVTSSQGNSAIDWDLVVRRRYGGF